MTDTPVLSLDAALRRLTPARVGLGRQGGGLSTRETLKFALDHARARDAVHTPMDVQALLASLTDLGLEALEVQSAALDRATYLTRPDLGAQLDAPSRLKLETREPQACNVLIVAADGLSSQALQHVPALLEGLLPRLRAANLSVGPLVLARNARVALGDEIALLCRAQMVLVLIGERPGLSSPASLGAYLTYGPRVGCLNADRNCVSNIHGAGLLPEQATETLWWLIHEGLTRRLTGVALKDESGLKTVGQLTDQG